MNRMIPMGRDGHEEQSTGDNKKTTDNTTRRFFKQIVEQRPGYDTDIYTVAE